MCLYELCCNGTKDTFYETKKKCIKEILQVNSARNCTISSDSITQTELQ